MPADEPISARPSLRERRRAAATQEILDAAESQLAEDGPAALSLRGVARSLGMTVQALYHYFPSRDSLVTSLVAKAYDDLADAVQAAVDTAGGDLAGGDSDLPRLVVATEGYRRWAIAHPEHFQLLYGTPLRYYAAPVDGPTTRAVRRMAAVFEREMFGGYTTQQLAAAEMPALSTELRTYLESVPPGGGPGSLPAPATALFLSAWGHMHGLVVLEVFGHTAYLGDHQAEIFRVTMRKMTADIDRRIPHM
ncbi:TetR/AcrR family transcriptional regulator [Streptomyces niveus]|uniref:TetR family transcriptional regulator n=1 Tax=Streptomyces niveus TaxID=193462 RepID=A0A1U9QP49_STRNV|nr:TetR/AcrR family transcriptional regulator [Streptomyces niveus]AQU66042.1 TetR family transcriptional regulator [Streptomyces niveus]